MNIVEIANLEQASRSVMAYIPDDDPHNAAPCHCGRSALGILAACAFMLFAIVWHTDRGTTARRAQWV